MVELPANQKLDLEINEITSVRSAQGFMCYIAYGVNNPSFL